MSSIKKKVEKEGGLRFSGKQKKSTKGSPLITILTVVYNGGNHLEKTIESVLEQDYANIEYIIIDGNSSDNTLDIIQKYDHKIDYWISEPDQGIYDAMNKGQKLATGDYINFLNAGDIIIDSKNISNICHEISSLNAVYFSRVKVVGDGVFWMYPSRETKNIAQWLTRNLPNHQTIFFPKSFYTTSLYDTRLSIGADDDYKLSALKDYQFNFIDVDYVEFKRDGVSSNHKSVKLLKKRIKESFIRNYKHKRWIRLFIDPFKVLLMFIIHSVFGDKNFLYFIKFILKVKK